MIRLTINNIVLWTILIGIFFIPFNSWSGIGFLGEYYRDSCFLFFSFAFVLTLLKKRIQIPLNNLIGNTSKAKKIFKWKPKIQIDELIKEMLKSDLNQK